MGGVVAALCYGAGKFMLTARTQQNATDPALHEGKRSGDPLLWVRWGTVVTFAAAAVCYVAFSWRWRMAVDTPVMHYVVFLMRHGLRPYSGITDNNLPGAYLTEAAAMRVFGGGDTAWRVYEFALMGVLAASAVVLTRRRDWVAGVFGAGMFVVLHSAEGPQLAVERDLLIGVLLMAACALLVEAVDGSLPVLMLPFGFLSGVASSVKPTVLPLPLVLLGIAMWQLRRRRVGMGRSVLYAAAGLLLAGGMVGAFLWHYHAWSGLLFVLRKVVPAYRDLSRMRMGRLLAVLLPRAVLAVTLLAVPLLVHSVRRGAWDWLMVCVAVCSGFGLLSYVAQGKGYVYHRYIFIMFLLVLVGMEIFRALAEHGWPRWVAGAALLVALGTVPGHLRTAHAVVGQTSFELTMERDLAALGPRQALQGRVQCFDLVYGCLDALYHLQLVDDAGFTGDMLFFAPQVSAPVLFYRERFWRYAAQEPAQVIVVSNGVFAEPNSYAKLQRWPEFAGYLASHYTMVKERSFPHERYGYYDPKAFPEGECDSYRIYVRDGSPLLPGVRALEADAVAVGR